MEDAALPGCPAHPLLRHRPLLPGQLHLPGLRPGHVLRPAGRLRHLQHRSGLQRVDHHQAQGQALRPRRQLRSGHVAGRSQRPGRRERLHLPPKDSHPLQPVRRRRRDLEGIRPGPACPGWSRGRLGWRSRLPRERPLAQPEVDEAFRRRQGQGHLLVHRCPGERPVRRQALPLPVVPLDRRQRQQRQGRSHQSGGRRNHDRREPHPVRRRPEQGAAGRSGQAGRSGSSVQLDHPEQLLRRPRRHLQGQQPLRSVRRERRAGLLQAAEHPAEEPHRWPLRRRSVAEVLHPAHREVRRLQGRRSHRRHLRRGEPTVHEHELQQRHRRLQGRQGRLGQHALQVLQPVDDRARRGLQEVRPQHLPQPVRNGEELRGCRRRRTEHQRCGRRLGADRPQHPDGDRRARQPEVPRPR